MGGNTYPEGEDKVLKGRTVFRPRRAKSLINPMAFEYNFNRPHQSLGYLTPVEYIEKELAKADSKVSPM